MPQSQTHRPLSPKMMSWLRAAARAHLALQARDERGEVYAEQVERMPRATRDALMARGLYAKHTMSGMGGGFTYYRITDEGLAAVQS